MDPIFVSVHVLEVGNPDAVKTIVNLRNIRAVTERSDYSMVETSAESVGVVRVMETWDDLEAQVKRGGVLRIEED